MPKRYAGKRRARKLGQCEKKRKNVWEIDEGEKREKEKEEVCSKRTTEEDGKRLRRAGGRGRKGEKTI